MAYPPLKKNDLFSNDIWEINYIFKEFKGDEKNIYVFEIDFTRIEPAYLTGIVEFFVTEEYVKERIEWLRINRNITEYHWSSVDSQWIEF